VFNAIVKKKVVVSLCVFRAPLLGPYDVDSNRLRFNDVTNAVFKMHVKTENIEMQSMFNVPNFDRPMSSVDYYYIITLVSFGCFFWEGDFRPKNTRLPTKFLTKNVFLNRRLSIFRGETQLEKMSPPLSP
jgi:hypothetical protein